jgi:hypothetical protein
MLSILLTKLVSQPVRGWLNTLASVNIAAMLVTRDVDKWAWFKDRGNQGQTVSTEHSWDATAPYCSTRTKVWLKAKALKNMLSILLTRLVFQLVRGWLNALASVNIPAMFVTLNVEKWSFFESRIIVSAHENRIVRTGIAAQS